MTPGDHFGYLGIENRFTFCIRHLASTSDFSQSSESLGEKWVDCDYPGRQVLVQDEEIFWFFLFWNSHRKEAVMECFAERRKRMVLVMKGFWWLGRHHNSLTWHNSHNLTSQDDAKGREAATEKWQRVRLFAWAGWMHRNNLMHTTQRGVAHAENIQRWSSEHSLVLGWVFIWSSIQCGCFCVLSSQFLQNKQFYQWNLPFGRVDSKQFHSRYAGVRIHPHLKTRIHSSDIAIYILLYRCLLVMYDIIR